MKERLLTQSAGQRDERSRRIAEKVMRLQQFYKAANIHFYMSMSSEVETGFLMDRAFGLGKHVLLPVTDLRNKELDWYEVKSRRGLKKGALGILEPDISAAGKFAGAAECVLVPGLVFDNKNYRIGRGAGLYDRFLSKLPPYVYKVGLAFSFQVIPEIPVNKHDVQLDEVITD